jgi:hypothetical protein
MKQPNRVKAAMRAGRKAWRFLTAAVIRKPAIADRHQIGPSCQDLIVNGEAGSILAETTATRLAHAHHSRAPAPTMIQEIGFALDSALEEDRFEPSVPIEASGAQRMRGPV